MKKILCTLALSLAITAPAFAQKASTEAVRELLEITKTEQLINQSYAQLEPIIDSTIASIEQAQSKPLDDTQKKALEIYSKKISQIFQEEMSWKKIEPEFIQIYTNVYTQDEITGLIDFYKTPVGQSTIDKMPEVTNKSIQFMQTQMLEIMPKITEALDQAFQEAEK